MTLFMATAAVLLGLWLLLWGLEAAVWIIAVALRLLAPAGLAVLVVLLAPFALVAVLCGWRPQAG